jgi:hypothetical protein
MYHNLDMFEQKKIKVFLKIKFLNQIKKNAFLAISN